MINKTSIGSTETAVFITFTFCSINTFYKFKNRSCIEPAAICSKYLPDICKLHWNVQRMCNVQYYSCTVVDCNWNANNLSSNNFNKIPWKICRDETCGQRTSWHEIVRSLYALCAKNAQKTSKFLVHSEWYFFQKCKPGCHFYNSVTKAALPSLLLLQCCWYISCKQYKNVEVLLTVHLSIILVTDQTNAPILVL